MRLKFNFEDMELDNQIVAVPVGENVSEFRGVIKMNETASRILELLKHETTIDVIIDTLAREYEAPLEVITDDVQKCISEFQAKGLLEQ